jgi:hypothetical protein
MAKAVRLAKMGWPWKSEDGAGSIILVSDEQFINLAARPDEAVEKPAPWFDHPVSLHDFCRDLAERGATKIHIAYDYFFGGSERGLYPDTLEFITNLKKIHDVAQQYGLGIEPSVLSPLELGVGYRARTGESGRWMQYGEGLRDPQTGRYAVQLWQHRQWVNNKGPMPVRLSGVRAFAYRETLVAGTPFFAVRRDEMRELPAPRLVEYPGSDPVVYGAPAVAENPGRRFQAVFTNVEGEGLLPGETAEEGNNRVLVVMIYETIEMDYFTPAARQFVLDLVGQIHASEIELEGVYSDEMHIQQDWVYHHHHDRGQFTLRYVSPGFERAFAEQFGEQYADFAPWLVYFTCHQHHFLATHEPKLPSQHVFGTGQAEIQATLKMRADYYKFLTGGVVDLMNSAREKLEVLQGKPLDAYYHSTWAESPTCDVWAIDGVQRDWSPEEHSRKYEYTPDFVWSNTIQQASSACADYFAWNEFLTGGNNDVPEGGFADRNYYGRALACSLAVLNRSPLASCGMWGMPPDSRDRMEAVSAAFGAGGRSIFRAVQDYAPRMTEVLFLYPIDLSAVEERFGGWMVQYGYANYITGDLLAREGHVGGGWLWVHGQSYRVVCMLYEPFPAPSLQALLREFVSEGGTVVWSGMAPQVPDATEFLEEVFGVRVLERGLFGRALPGRTVRFCGNLASVAPMSLLTDFVVDRVTSLALTPFSEAVAEVHPGGGQAALTVGSYRQYPGGGQAVYLGFRPRDDQSASTGEEVRTWFEIIAALGIHEREDDPTAVSRRGPYLACTFPNGAVGLAPHYRTHVESWSGGFFRDAERDRLALADNPVPGEEICLQNLCVAGQDVNYIGRHCVCWRLDNQGDLIAFAGIGARGIEINGRSWRWSETPVDLAWHPLGPAFKADIGTPRYRLWCGTTGVEVRIPLEMSMERAELWIGSPRVGMGLAKIPYSVSNGALEITIGSEIVGRWLYLINSRD